MTSKFAKPLAAAILLGASAATSQAHAALWYWVPSRITNANPGDAIVSSDPHGLIGTLLRSVGQYWSHSGMFIDQGYTIRHNTGDPNTVQVMTDDFGLPDHVNWATLQTMQPGLITQSVPNAFGASGSPNFNFFDYDDSYNLMINRNAAVLTRSDTTPIGGSIYYWGAAQTMTEYEAFYGFYSYTDVWTTEPDHSDPQHLYVAPDVTKYNMCAGTIAWALFRGGLDVWPWTYTAQVRDAAAPVLYKSVYDQVGKKVPNMNILFIAGLVDPGLAPLAGLTYALAAYVSDTAKTNIANQVVNCMAFNDCGNTGGRWRNGVGVGYSLSPDNLAPVGYVNPNNPNKEGIAWGMSGWDPSTPFSQWYDSVLPVSYSGGYWKKY